MSKPRVSSFAVSIDGFGAGTSQDLENPIGVGPRSSDTNGVRWSFAPPEGLLAEPDVGLIPLEVTGPPGTAQFLDQLVTGA